MNNTTTQLIEKILKNQRLSLEEGKTLYNSLDLLTLGALANRIKERLHPDKCITFVVDRNINYTNICICKCNFCAYYRSPDHPEAFLLSQEIIDQKIRETLAVGGTQILLQGGLHPDLDINYFLNLFSHIKKNLNITLHAFSPPEIIHIARLSKLSIKKTLRRLKEAGLDSVPGGGAEVLVDRVRKKISPSKISVKEWLGVMEEAHKIGLPTTATMMFGSIDNPEDRLRHLISIRELQDKTHGFTAFIPWSFQAANTKLPGYSTSGVEYLKMLAISRIMLDNFNNIQASWVTQGDKIAQVALKFGANDLGSTMLEENVVKAAGLNFRMDQEDIIRLIKEADYIPAQRDNVYNIIKVMKSE
ncbi:MAG: cyclic dehypoxanthinyl futalosine synthase [bacterium]